MQTIFEMPSDDTSKTSVKIKEAGFTEARFSLGDKSLAGAIKGDKHLPILMCLHGWLDNAASFIPMMPFFERSHQVIVIEWPGHGQSDHRSPDAHYHFIDWVFDLLALFENQQWLDVDIVAHSMGGMVASAFAAAFPEKVRSLTLIDSVGFVTAEETGTTAQLKKGLESRLKSRLAQNERYFELAAATNARVAVSDLSTEHAELIVERSVNSSAKGCQWRSDPRLRNISPYRLSLPQAQQLIKDIQCPVQLIHGNKGMKMVQEGIKHYAELFTEFDEVAFEGGHHVHMEQPEKTVKQVHAFIKKASS